MIIFDMQKGKKRTQGGNSPYASTSESVLSRRFRGEDTLVFFVWMNKVRLYVKVSFEYVIVKSEAFLWLW